MEFTASTVDELASVAEYIANRTRRFPLVCFYGVMGAGKTTLIKAICKQLNVEEAVNSPTYSIVNEYETTDEEVIYHFDFYRIKSEEEALDFGLEDYLYSSERCFMEWPEKIGQLLPNERLNVTISSNEAGIRTITVKENV